MNFLKFYSDRGGGSLPFSLIIIILISLISTLVLGISLIQVKSILALQQKEQLRLYAKSGFNLFHDSLKVFNTPQHFQLPDSTPISLELIPYGYYAKIRSRAIHKNQSSIYEYLTAGFFENNQNAAINILDRQLDLTLSKKTMIYGNIFFGNQRFQTSPWKGSPYIGKFEGFLTQSPDSLVFKLPTRTLNMFLQDLSRFKNRSKNVTDFQTLNSTLRADTVLFSSPIEIIQLSNNIDSIKNKIIFIDDDLTIKSPTVIMNCMIISTNKISFEHIQLINSILFSNEILLKNSSSSVSQIISKLKITISDSKLKNHSIVSVIGEESNNHLSGDIVIKNCIIDGSIIIPLSPLSSEIPDDRLLTIDENSIINGIVINYAGSTILGTIYGQIATKYFFESDGTTRFINWITSGTFYSANNLTTPYGISHSKKYTLLSYEVKD